MKNLISISLLFLLPILLNALEVEVVPTFESASVYLHDTTEPTLSLQYRSGGNEEWRNTPPVLSTENNPLLRTSILGLKENRDYQLRVLKDGEEIASTEFRTMSSEVPVAKTITLGTGPVEITESGTPDGWIRYVASSPIDGGEEAESAILINNANYIILEDLTVIGGRIQAIMVHESSNIRILNCDISGWGEAGEQDFRRRGQFFNAEKQGINRQAGVFILESESVVVERCYIHDPRGQTNSWAFSHPAGPCGIYIKTKGNTVIRYNDIIGSDRHRWNDAIEAFPNNSPEGGFRQDADIYGNNFYYGNDDAIELDGGQMNMRVWGNKIEGTFAGVSTAPSIYGPSYIYNNLIVNLGDMYGYQGSIIKNNYRSGTNAQGHIYLFHNTMVSPTSGISNFGHNDMPQSTIFIKNNVLKANDVLYSARFHEEPNKVDHNLLWIEDAAFRSTYAQQIADSPADANGLFHNPEFLDSANGDYRLQEKSIQQIAQPEDWFPTPTNTPGITDNLPLRPIPQTVSRPEVRFNNTTTETLTLNSDSNTSESFQILQNSAFDWFTVTADAESVSANNPVSLTIHLNGKVKGLHRGAFIVKMENGFSRVVTVYAGEEQTLPILPNPEEVVAFIEAEDFKHAENFKHIDQADASGGTVIHFPATPQGEVDETTFISYTIDVPEDGIYYLGVRCYVGIPNGLHNSFFFRMEDEEFRQIHVRNHEGSRWAGVSFASRARGANYAPYRLSKGPVTIYLSPRESLLVDAVALVRTPLALHEVPKDQETEN